MSKKGAVAISDLCVIEFNTRYFSDEVRDWKERRAVPSAMSCDSQVLFGVVKDFDDFPHPDNKDAVKEYYGADAYECLLEIVSGLGSQRIGETHIRNQFFGGWKAFLKQNTEKGNAFQALIGTLKKDTNYINKEIMAGLKTRRHTSTARDLSGQAKGDTVLVVPSLTKKGALGEFTIDMIYLSGFKQGFTRKNPKGTNHIRVLVDENNSDAIIQEIDQQKELTRIKSKIDLVERKDIEAQVQECERVYVALPMGSDQPFEEQLINAWCCRQRRDNTLTHVSGTPMLRMGTSAPWDTDDLNGTNYIAPEMIIQENTQRRKNNEAIAKETVEFVNKLARFREEGVTLPPAMILEMEEDKEEPEGNLDNSIEPI